MNPEIKTRTPCEHQGKPYSDPLVNDEDTPCLICSGNVLSTRTENHICPFTESIANEDFVVFRDGVNMDYITDVEKAFAKTQQAKIARIWNSEK